MRLPPRWFHTSLQFLCTSWKPVVEYNSQCIDWTIKWWKGGLQISYWSILALLGTSRTPPPPSRCGLEPNIYPQIILTMIPIDICMVVKWRRQKEIHGKRIFNPYWGLFEHFRGEDNMRHNWLWLVSSGHVSFTMSTRPVKNDLIKVFRFETE
jgi:hypothetical protein